MTVIFATGGTGGHIFPALQTALELKQRGHRVIFAGALTLAKQKIEQQGFVCHDMAVRGFQDRSVFGIMRSGGLMAQALGQACGIVRQAKPDCIVGFGGYSSFPLIIAGFLMRCRTMIHEQNVVPGQANRVLSKCVSKIAVSFKSSLTCFGKANVVWTGCPCHDTPPQRSRQDVARVFGLNPDVKIIVLLGGSQGSKRLNEVFFETIQSMSQTSPVQAVHVTGNADYALYTEKYRHAGLAVTVTAFVSPIEELYALADVIVARCGAATISELGAFALPAVLVPYPFAGGHQKFNAHVLTNAGAAVLLEQNNLTVQSLTQAIHDCSTDAFTRTHIAAKTQGLFLTRAAARLADAVEQS